MTRAQRQVDLQNKRESPDTDTYLLSPMAILDQFCIQIELKIIGQLPQPYREIHLRSIVYEFTGKKNLEYTTDP